MKFIVNNETELDNALEKITDGDSIFLKKGVYKRKIKLSQNNVTITGESADDVIISNNDYSTKIHNDNKEYNTFRTYTFMVIGNNVKIENLTIRNTKDNSFRYGQAVSLHVLGNNFSLKNAKVLGGQDTLLCGPIPDDLIIRYENFLPKDELLANNISYQVYEDCYIEGDVDFIFGGGNCLFLRCEIKTIGNKDTSYICAPSHTTTNILGFTFIDCTFTCANTVDLKSTYLARPWRSCGKAVFINCTYDNHIKEEGFSNWDNTNHFETCYFAEFNHLVDYSKRLINIKWSKKDLDEHLGLLMRNSDKINYTLTQIYKFSKFD